MQGFNLFEMTLLLFIISILAGMSYPSYHTYRMRYASQRVVKQIRAGILFAKVSSIAQQKKIILCASDDGRHCTSNWTKGFLIANLNSDGKINKVIRIYPVIKYGTLSWQGFPQRDYLLFSPDVSEFMQNGKFVFTPIKKLSMPDTILYLNRFNRLRVERVR